LAIRSDVNLPVRLQPMLAPLTDAPSYDLRSPDGKLVLCATDHTGPKSNGPSSGNSSERALCAKSSHSVDAHPLKIRQAASATFWLASENTSLRKSGLPLTLQRDKSRTLTWLASGNAFDLSVHTSCTRRLLSGPGSIPVGTLWRPERHGARPAAGPAVLFLSANAARHPAGTCAGIGSNQR
jgi:hypothetical protein